jgi:hypothetical protein
MNREPEQQGWVLAWTERVEALGLSSMVLLLIEIARPFGLLGGQVLLALEPLLAGIVTDGTVTKVSALLQDPGLLNHLECHLEKEHEVS